MVPVVILALFATCSTDAAYAQYGANDWYSNVCRDDQWTCQTSRECIPLSGMCDGKVDCSDRSDESHAVCRNIISCPLFTFRCTYGACVDVNAKCNGAKDCLDGSDEVHCVSAEDPPPQREVNGIFQCSDSARIPSSDRCDGVVHCADGSDETLAACAGRRCAANLFQCKYGACVDADAACDPYGTKHCVDGSDEAPELCSIQKNRPSTMCTLPDYPAKGTYTVINNENAEPGQSFRSVTLRVSCDHPNNISVSYYADCYYGLWSDKMKKCTSFCKVPTNEGTEYLCGYESYDIHTCKNYQPNRARIHPICNGGYRYRKIEPRVMTCIDGDWNRIVKCENVTQTCGLPKAAKEMMIGGAAAKRYEMPWHAGIYDKSSGEHKQICGGSLVSLQLVISAAHCFWNDVKHQLPHTNYAVALGQLKRQWNTEQGQLFNVSSILLPPTYQGETTLYRADIALVYLDKPAEYRDNVRPVCLDLELSLDQNQKTDGKLGKVAGWGLTAEDGQAADELIVSELPTVSNIKCINDSHADFKRYIDDEKLCAGNFSRNALCEGDSGGGLVFRDGPGQPYYLRGVASIRYNNDHACNTEGYTTFTRVFHYAEFIMKNSNGTL